jgi:hypothetical protein
LNHISPRRRDPLVSLYSLVQTAALAVILLAAASCERQNGGITDPVFSPSLILDGSLARNALYLDSASVYVVQNGDGSYTITDTITAFVRPAALSSAVSQMSYHVVRRSATMASGILRRSASLSDSVRAVFQGVFSMQIERGEAGTFMVGISASRSDGGASPSIVLPLLIARANAVPLPGVPNVRQLTVTAADSVRFFASIAVADSDGLNDITRVEARVHGSNDSATVLELRDDGSLASGDLAAGDGVFSTLLWVTPTVSLSQVVFEFSATDAANHVSPPVYRALQNHRPRILQLGVPDSIQRPASGTTLIPFHLTAADSDGLPDIDSVYFFNASGTPPIPIIAMYDDGNLGINGDSTAGDGIFSRIVQISSSNTTGLKEFHFLVVDRAGERDEVIKNIKVY